MSQTINTAADARNRFQMDNAHCKEMDYGGAPQWFAFYGRDGKLIIWQKVGATWERRVFRHDESDHPDYVTRYEYCVMRYYTSE